MSEKPSAMELLSNVGLEIAKPGLKTFFMAHGVDEKSAEAMSSAFCETVKWTSAYFLANPGSKVKNQERLEFERFAVYLDQISKFASSNKAYMLIDQKFEENPGLTGLVDRIIRNVEQESLRSKIHYYANLTHSAIIGPVNNWKLDEKITYAAYILDMTSLDFEILRISDFHMSGQMTDDEGEVHGLFGGMAVTLSTIRSSVNPSVDILRSNPALAIPDGIVDAALNRLTNFGLLHKRLPNKWNQGSKSNDPETEFFITASGIRFHNWCMLEAN